MRGGKPKKNDGVARSVTVEVIEAIADVKGVEYPDIGIVLNDYVDVDALEALDDHQNSSWTLTFEIPEYTVTVSGDKTVFAERREDEHGE